MSHNFLSQSRKNYIRVQKSIMPNKKTKAYNSNAEHIGALQVSWPSQNSNASWANTAVNRYPT